jgi:hypothetical protein
MIAEGSLAHGRALPLIADVMQDQSREEYLGCSLSAWLVRGILIFSPIPFLIQGMQ